MHSAEVSHGITAEFLGGAAGIVLGIYWSRAIRQLGAGQGHILVDYRNGEGAGKVVGIGVLARHIGGDSAVEPVAKEEDEGRGAVDDA